MLKEFQRQITGYEIKAFNGGAKFRNGDTLLAKITPCLENGKTAFVDILDDGEVAFGSTEFIVLRAKWNQSRISIILQSVPILENERLNVWKELPAGNVSMKMH